MSSITATGGLSNTCKVKGCDFETKNNFVLINFVFLCKFTIFCNILFYFLPAVVLICFSNSNLVRLLLQPSSATEFTVEANSIFLNKEEKINPFSFLANFGKYLTAKKEHAFIRSW